MKRADLHVHSKYSDQPADWFLQRLGAAESYTDPEDVYRAAIARGLDFVTLTDHNCVSGALELQARHPERVFTGVEATTGFPEDGCKIHLLIYGLTAQEFQEIERHRGDIYRLRDYVRDRGLAYSVAHATYAVNQRLTVEHLEKLILLFDVFEGQNGARNEIHNSRWTSLLRALTPDMIRRLHARHGIQPVSDTPWIKGFTGGSDDHAALFIGTTYTRGHARSVQEFLRCLRDKRTLAGGRNSNYRALAFSIYKIAYDHSKTKCLGAAAGLPGQIASSLFERERVGLLERLRLALHRQRSDSGLDGMVAELAERLQDGTGGDIESRIEAMYDRIAGIADEIVRLTCETLRETIREGDVLELHKTASLALPGIMLAAPFLTTFRHLHADKQLLAELADRLGIPKQPAGRKILWFTDTLNDLNGVSVTLRDLGWMAHREGRDLRLVTSLLPEELSSEIPPNVIALPYYESLRVKVPSVLTCLKELFAVDPDEVFISSPGPVGLLGLLMGWLLGAPCRGIYHTDFTAEAARLAPDESLAELVEVYTKWFYSLCQAIQVPTDEYRRLLATRGYPASQMGIFPRGIDTEVFAPRNGAGRARPRVPDGRTLLYVGRVSPDKNVDFLSDVYERVAGQHPEVNLVVAGDGPALESCASGSTGTPGWSFRAGSVRRTSRTSTPSPTCSCFRAPRIPSGWRRWKRKPADCLRSCRMLAAPRRSWPTRSPAGYFRTGTPGCGPR
jgi:predicted metal-dependent phosphoesterase TrpH/glycosyltransferase involved in cell wall biosynthesis